MTVTTPPIVRQADAAARASPPALAPSRTEIQRRNRVAGMLLILLGVAILGSWAAWLAEPARNPLAQGLGTIQDGHYTMFLLLAEGLMATTALLSGWGLLKGYWWATRVAHVAIGLMLYSTLYTLGFSLLTEPFLTPIMLAGLAGALAAVALLWTPDASLPGAVQPNHMSVNGESALTHEVTHLRVRLTMIRAGGVISLLFFVLHVLFWQMLDWPRSLAVLPADGAGIMQTLNATVAVTMLLFGYVSLFRARALLRPGLGRALSLGIALFWVARAVSGAVFLGFGPDAMTFLVIAALYAAPQFGGTLPVPAERR